MANFDVVEYGYDIADETINFGTRALADGSNLHEAATLATLKCSGEAVETSPQISAVTRNGRVYFAVDKTMRVFKDKGCSEVIFNVMFDCLIETFTLASDGSYLLICLESGLVHVLDCNTDEFNCVSTQSVFELDDNCSFVGSFSESSEDEVHSFLLILDTGKILRLTMEEGAVHLDVVQKLQASIRNVTLSYPFLLLNGSRLVCLNLEDSSVMYNDYGLVLKNVFPLYNSFLALDLSGQLLRICARTLIINYIIDKSDEVFEDLLLLSDEEEDLIQLAGVTKDTDDQLNIVHLSYPEFSTIFSLKIRSKVYLITPESINDEIMYISEIHNSRNQISELRFHVVYETEAERRLQRLLRKKKFDEAEQFARTFGMDMDKVAEAKAQIIVDKTVTDTDDIKTLLELLNRIESDEFKVQSCVNVESSCTNLKDVRKVLSFGCKMASKTKQEINKIWIDKVTDLMSRCEAYLMIKRGKGYSMSEWVKFATCDLSDELIFYLKNHKIEEALMVLSLFTELTIIEFDRILKTLDCIPNDAYEVFLPTFVPFCFEYLAQFVEWTTNKIFYFETRREFPDNAIRFAGHVIELLDRFSQDYSSKPDQSFTQLLNLITALKCLKQLKDDFRIKAPISAYLAGPESFASTLLREMAPGNYDPFVKEFLFHFMMCHNLELNEILLNEIENVTMYEENYWIDIVGSIVNCMSSIDSKLKAVGTLLDMASVPWNDTIRNIANGVLQYSHPSVTEIKERLQNEPILIVLKRPKYEIKENSVNNMEDVRYFASRMIYCNEPTMIEDVHTLSKTPRQRHEVNMLLIRNFISKGELEKALKVLDNNSPQEVLVCARETFSMADLLIHSVDFNDPITCPKVTENYYKILGSIFERIKENTRDSIALEFDEETFHLLNGVFNLKKHFNFNTNTHYLRCNQTEVIDQVLEETLCKFETGKIGVDDVFAACNRISAHLGSSQDNVIVKFCTKAHNFDVILKTGQSLYENDSSAKNLCLIAILLLKYLGDGRSTVRLSESRCSSDEDSFGSCGNRNYSSEGVHYSEESLCHGLKLAEKLVAKALVCADHDDLSACMEVFSWVNMSFYITKGENSALYKTLFGDTFSGSVMPGYSTFSAICNHFNLFCEFVANFNNPDRKFLTYFKQYGATPMSKETLLDELSMLPTTVESLWKEGQPYTAYKITNTLKNCLAATPNPDPEILNLLNSVLKKQCILRLLRDALNRDVIDVGFLYNLLLSCDMDDAIKFVKDSLRSHKRCPNKFGCMALVGYRYWKHHELPGKSKIASIILSVKWWNKVQKVNLNYDKFFQVDALTRLEMLLIANCIGLELLEEYCSDFGLKSQTAYALYFKKTLCNWKPQYDIKTELGNKRKLVITSDETSLYNQCKLIADHINNKNQIFETINHIWNSINFYYYEVFMAIMNIMIYVNPKSYDDQKMKMLVFLKDYQRVSEPGDMETQQYYTAFPDARTLDPLSEFRLPYTQSLFAKDVWNIIRPEINLKTYRIWFDVLTILRTYLNKDEICCYVVKAIVSSGILNPGSGEKKWVLYPQHAELLSEIDECVQNICDLEKTTSAVYHLMSNTTNGADQVNAASLCHKYALQYKRDNPGSNDVELAFTKVEKKYHMYSAMHILHMHQLAEERYLNLVTNPHSLIMSLYFDERIISKELISHQCPDINAATTALAKLFELNIEKKRFDLINQWILDQDTTSSDFDASLFANETLIDAQNSCALDNNNVIKRSAYICNGSEFLRNYLFKIGTNENGDYSVDCKVRALKVFAFVSDDATITELTDLQPDEFKNWIDKLTAVSMLQNLGVCLDTLKLDKSSKKELLTRLMKRPENALLISTMALICTTYTMYDLKYWEYILAKAVKLQMHSSMKNYLDFLKNQKCNHKSFYVKAWQSYIDHIFTYIDTLKDSEQFDVLVNNFLLIQACPVKHSLKFEYVLRKCKDAGRHEFAALSLQYISEEKVNEIYLEVLNNAHNIDEKLDELRKSGLWGIPQVKSLLDELRLD